MANDFSGDSNCKAVWGFNDAGGSTVDLTDGKGSNDLTDNNTVQFDGADFQEGDASMYLALANGEYASILDSALDSGFPLKSGETNDDFTICMWAHFDSSTAFHTLMSKYDRSTTNGKSFMLRVLSNELQVFIGHTNGTGFEELTNNNFTGLSTGTWYHIGFAFENTTKTWEIRFYNGSTSSSVTGTATNNISIVNTALAMGAAYTNGSAERYFDGNLDEIVVFDRKLTATEMDEIRSGTYSSGGGTNIPLFMHHYTKNLRT